MKDIPRLHCDPRNVAHIARHGVTPEEVEQALRGIFIARQTYGNRRMIIGPVSEARIVAIVLEMRPDGSAYPVTARPASRKERRLYYESFGGP